VSEPKAAAAQAFEQPLANAAATVASFDSQRRSPLHALQHLFHANPALVPLVVLVLSVTVFSLLVGERFYQPFTLTLILQQVAIVGIVAAAQTLVILTAGIDLSVGAVMVLSSVVMGQFTFRYGLPAPVSVLCGFACGALCGWINGVLVAHFRLPPFIVTLGTWQIFLATNFIYSANETIRGQDLEAQAPLLLFFAGNFKVGDAIFTYGVVAMILLIGVLWYVLNKTAWGRHVYAIGDDPDAAELAGVQTRRMLVQVYMLSGAICALAGWVLIGRIESVAPNSGQTANIEAITAVVIGGISLFGGRGSILGTIFGALIVGVFALGLRMWGTDPQWTYLTTGLLIIIAVAIDQWIRRVAG
jgi:fructose transport system permease protein